MGGLAKICKLYGGMTVRDVHDNQVAWVWDYVNDKPRRATEMTKEEKDASDKAKRLIMKGALPLSERKN